VKCQGKRESCGVIGNRSLCESLGISLSGECLWLLEHQNENRPEQQCIEKVLIFPFFFFFFKKKKILI
jgi:hypothetical protein